MNHLRSLRVSLIAAGLGLCATTAVFADITSDQAAALLLYPRVINAGIGERIGETVIQLTNASNATQNLHCFYVDASSRCSSSERVCDTVESPCGANEGLCLPRWIETDFDVVLTPRQPLAWAVSQGLRGTDLPLTGAIVGPGNSTNIGTRVPPVAFGFFGELKCIVVDGVGNPLPSNVVTGNATLIARGVGGETDFSAGKDNAIGVKAIDGDADRDNVLVLGGGAGEYNGCPQVLIVNHFFDFGDTPGGPLVSRLTLVPCSEDLRLQIPGSTTAQYLVFNEFEQRFSTSAPVDCYFDRQLSLIDTRNPDRSIFSVFVAGTIAGQTRVRGVQQGLLGVLTTIGEDGSQASNNLHFQGDRELPDTWVLP